MDCLNKPWISIIEYYKSVEKGKNRSVHRDNGISPSFPVKYRGEEGSADQYLKCENFCISNREIHTCVHTHNAKIN